MKRIKCNSIILALILILLGINSLAQNQIIRGRLIPAIAGNAIAGLKIGVHGVENYTSVNSDGEFRLKIPESVEQVKFIGFDFEILEVKVHDDNFYEIFVSTTNLSELSFEELINIKVNVSSTKSENVFQTPSTVSVIDREMLEQYNFLNVAEMLRTAVGIDIYQSNNDDNIATSRGILQNYYANKILVMIENIPTYQPIYGNTNLDRLDVNDIERIEVLKGPASVLYGSNAYLGVVNIILRKGKDGDVNVRLAAGSHRLGAAGANVSMANQDFKLFISGNSGYEIRKPYELEGKLQDLYRGSTTIQFQEELKSTNFNILSSYKSVSVLLNNYEYQHAFLGINPSFISGAQKPMTDRGTLLALKYNKNLNEKFNLLANATIDYFKRNYASNQDGSSELMLTGQRLIGTVKLNYNISKMLDLEFGFDAERRMKGEHVSIDVLQDIVLKQNLKNAKDINEVSSFFQLDYNARVFNVLGGIRYTKNSVSGANVSGRISAIANLSEYNSFKFIFGQSFRAPTMLELYFDHPTVVGNINLKPEKANSIELAFVHGKNNWFVQMLGYHHKLDNLIQRYTPSSGPPSHYQNLSSFEGYGFEFETKYRNPKTISAFFNYNFMNGVGSKAESNYKHVPMHTFKAGANKSFGSFFTSANGYAVSSVLGNPKLNIPISAQMFVDLHFGYKQKLPSKKIKLTHTLSAKNIGNSQMLIPEYIRQTDNINSQETMGFGRRFIYTLLISI